MRFIAALFVVTGMMLRAAVVLPWGSVSSLGLAASISPSRVIVR